MDPSFSFFWREGGSSGCNTFDAEVWGLYFSMGFLFFVFFFFC